MILSGLARDQAGAKRRGGAPKARRVGGFLARMPRTKELSTGGGVKLLVKHLYTYLKPLLAKNEGSRKANTDGVFYRLHVPIFLPFARIPVYRSHVDSLPFARDWLLGIPLLARRSNGSRLFYRLHVDNVRCPQGLSGIRGGRCLVGQQAARARRRSCWPPTTPWTKPPLLASMTLAFRCVGHRPIPAPRPAAYNRGERTEADHGGKHSRCTGRQERLGGRG